MNKDAILYWLSPDVVWESQKWTPGITLEIIPERSSIVRTFNQPRAIVCVKPDGEPEEYMMVPYHVQDWVVSRVDTILYPTHEQVRILQERGIIPTR